MSISLPNSGEELFAVLGNLVSGILEKREQASVRVGERGLSFEEKERRQIFFSKWA